MSVEYKGRQFDARTIEMLKRLEWKTGLDLAYSQGSYSTGVSQSGGTHAGGGAADVSVRNLSLAQKNLVVLTARQIGFAAWRRLPSQGDWAEHVHMIAIHCQDLSAAAESQVQQYYRGENGLANHGPDDGPDGYQQVTWERYNAAHPDEEFLMSVGDDILAELKSVKSTLNGFINTEAGRYTVDANRYTDIKRAVTEAVAEAATAEDESLAGGRYSALQNAITALTTKVDALPKA